MKGFAKFCTAMYFVLLLVFGVFFGIFVMKQMGNDDDITGLILYSIGGIIINFICTYFIVGKLIEKFTKSGSAYDVGLFLVQLVLTVAIVFLSVGSEWVFHSSGSGSSDKGTCAWCGKYEELTGKFCDDCNEKAFGKDGWYN